MKNKENLENFKETVPMLKDTVRPIYQKLTSIMATKHKKEWIYFLLPVILLYIGARMGVKRFLKINSFLSGVFGLIMIFCPQALLNITYNAEIDKSMRFVCSLYGCYQLASMFFPLYLINSKDKSIYISFYWSKIIENIMIVIETIIAYKSGLRWNHKIMCFAGSSSIVVALLMTYFLYNSNHKRSQFHFKLFQVNRIAKIDFILLLVCGLFLYAYPTTTMTMLGADNVHDGHLSMCRICGIIVIGLSIQSFCCPSFLFEADKMKFIQARLSMWFTELLTVLYGFYCVKTISQSVMCSFITCNLAYGLLLFYGYYVCAQQLNEYQHQVDISIMESEKSFNIKHSESETSTISESSLYQSTAKKDE